MMEYSKNFLILNGHDLPDDIIDDLKSLTVKNPYDYNTDYVIIVHFFVPEVQMLVCCVSSAYWIAIREILVNTCKPGYRNYIIVKKS